MRKKLLRGVAGAALAGLIAVGGASAAAIAQVALDPQEAHAVQAEGSWQNSKGKWWYSYAGGGYAKGWSQIDGKWYLFDGSGWMKTGWQKSGGKWYYLKGSGAMQTGWLKSGGKWYFLKDSGAMATGWAQDGGKWYYMDGSGAMKTGWQKVSGKWYYLKASGAMAEGWQKVGGSWYYLAPGSGKMLTGWQNIDGAWYYMDGSGAMQKSKWVGDYYLTGSGAMAANQWIGSYYVGSDGKWIKGYASSSMGNNSDSISGKALYGSWRLAALTTDGGNDLTIALPSERGKVILDSWSNSEFSLQINGEVNWGSWEYKGEDKSDPSSPTLVYLLREEGGTIWLAQYNATDGSIVLGLADDRGQLIIFLDMV